MGRSATVSGVQLNDIVSKMHSPDMDFRYMALNDLLSELRESDKLYDEQVANRLVESVLAVLEDKNGEVQNLAIMCLGPLIKRCHETQIQAVVEKLCKPTSNEEIRNTSATALRTVITQVSATGSVATSITKKLTPRLITQLRDTSRTSEALLDSIDILIELLNKFGRAVGALPTSQQSELIQVLTLLLDNARSAIRKRAVLALSSLVMYIPIDLFAPFMSEMIEMITITKTNDKLKTLIGLMGQLCRAETTKVGSGRFGEYIQTVAPAVIDALELEDDEIREVALQTLEAFVQQDGPQIKRYEDSIISLTLRFLKYDPNYAEQDNDEDMDGLEDASDLGSDFEDDVEYDDDDDISWKLRRCAVKLAGLLIRQQGGHICKATVRLAEALANRLNEREENVRVEIMHVFVMLLQKVKERSSQSPSLSRKRLRETDEMEVDSTTNSQDEILAILPKIMRSNIKQLGGKSVQVKQACFSVLDALCGLDCGLVLRDLPILLPLTSKSLTTVTTGGGSINTSALKLGGLEFLHAVTTNSVAGQLDSSLQDIITIVNSTLLKEKINKVVLVAISIAKTLLRVVKTNSATTSLGDLSDTLFLKMSESDLEQDVRDELVSAIGSCLSYGSSEVCRKASIILENRLHVESTRLVTTLTIGSALSSSNDNIDQIWLLSALKEISQYVRNVNRTLCLAAISTCTILVEKAGSVMTDKDVEETCQAILPLLSSEEPQVLHGAVYWLDALSRSVSQKATVRRLTLPSVLPLITSTSILSGATTEHLVAYFAAIARSHDNSELIEELYGLESSASTLNSLARFMATVLLSENTSDLFSRCVKETSAPKTPELRRSLNLYIIGEYGRHASVSEDIWNLVLAQFASPSEQVVAASSYCLGNLASNNVPVYLPIILQELRKTSDESRYLLLAALKEMITIAVGKLDFRDLATEAESICSILLDLKFEDRANGIVAESVGRLIQLRPRQLLPLLQQRIKSQSAASRGVVIRAIRYTFTSLSTQFDDQLRPLIPDFLSLMEDSSLEIRRLALSTLYSAAHNKPWLISDQLARLLPLLYKETVIKTELVRSIQMGPFKHIIDDGLELRKNAFETLHSLLGPFHSSVDMPSVLDIILRGLDDVHEIKTLCFLMISHLASVAPDAVRQKIDAIAQKLQALTMGKLKDSALKQDKEKDAELKRSALRCVMSLTLLADDLSPVFNTLLTELEAANVLE